MDEYEYDVHLQLKENLQLAGISIYTNDGQVKTNEQIADEVTLISKNIPPKLLGRIISNLNGNLITEVKQYSKGMFDF